MSAKNISKTIIEGGRTGFSKFDRYNSNEQFRAREKKFVHDIQGSDPDEPLPPKRRHVRKEFADKLSPMYRWLRKQVGRGWNNVYSDLRATFDTRTIAGSHVINDHLLRDVQLSESDVAGHGWADFVVDDRGILRMKEANRWNRNASRMKPTPKFGNEYVSRWARCRSVLVSGSNVFWMIPSDVIWGVCPRINRIPDFRSFYRAHYGTDRCSGSTHTKIDNLYRVNDSSKLLAIEKREMFSRIEDGELVYYRKIAVKSCRQPTGEFKHGPKLSKEDRKIWDELLPWQQRRLRYFASAKEYEEAYPYGR